jgi:uncharacterized membrane protein
MIMTQMIIAAALWFSALGAALIGGIYFAFSAFIMTSLERIPQAAGVAAMQSINKVILGSAFMPAFWVTTLASVALAVLGLMRWGEPGAPAMLAGGVIYVVGMFVFTIAFNVPLNNALDAVDPASAQAATVWARYLKDWTFWNTVRTVACLLASALFIYAIAER